MKARSYLVIVLLIVLLVLLVVLWPGGKDQRATITFGEIEQLNGQARTPPIAPEGISTPAISPASGTGIPTPVEIVSATPAGQDTIPESDPTLKSLQVSIMDALGDPIPAGQLRVAGKEYRFTEGRILVRVPGEGEQELVAEAEGYQTATKRIDVSNTDETTIVLEYLSSIEVTVYASEDKRDPAVGAEVFLWVGARPQRPVPPTATVKVEPGSVGGNLYDADLKIEKDVVTVADAETKKWERELPPDPDGRLKLSANDIIIGLGGCMYRSGDRAQFQHRHKEPILKAIAEPNSPRLRVWDTIAMCALAASDAGNSSKSEIMEFEGRFGRAHTYLRLPRPSVERKLVSMGTTDSQGRCRFDALEPGMYYVQARKGDERTLIVTVPPVRGGAEHHLCGGSKVTVEARATGVDLHYWDLSGIQKADVLLQAQPGTDNPGQYMGRTDDYGRVSFQSIPWGTYNLTVAPPPDYRTSPQQRTATIEDAGHYFLFFFDLGVTISGKVLRQDTQEPVEGFELILTTSTPRHQTVYYDAQRSDKEGHIVFRNVLPGWYTITCMDDNSNIEIGYAGGFLSAFVPSPQGGELKEMGEFEVGDEGIHGFVYYVAPSLQTRFSGRVTREDGSPASGVSVFIKGLMGYCTTESPTTDSDGQFDFILMLGGDWGDSIGKIQAQEADISPPYLDSNGMLVQNPGILHAEGFCKVPMHPGETVTGITIVLKQQPHKSIVGTIQTEDGEPPGEVNIYAEQGSFRMPGKMSEDGTYRIEGVTPGKAWLSFEPKSYQISSERFGFRYISDYCRESVQIEITQEQDTVTVDVVLHKSGHLAGIVVDENKNPAEGVMVRTVHLGFPQVVRTDVTGLFWIGFLRQDQEYTLEVLKNEDSEPLARFEGLKPTIENIIIGMKGEN
ncbi:MAG TPA: hypothetical protein PK395_20280 [bacterium]|nr:hypothetical protein [bacterium]